MNNRYEIDERLDLDKDITLESKEDKVLSNDMPTDADLFSQLEDLNILT